MLQPKANVAPRDHQHSHRENRGRSGWASSKSPMNTPVAMLRGALPLRRVHTKKSADE
jgi:hypothetical protein